MHRAARRLQAWWGGLDVSWPRLKRDTVLVTIGAVGFLHEVFLGTPTERPQLIYASIALMCSPLVLRGEEKLRNGNGNGKS